MKTASSIPSAVTDYLNELLEGIPGQEFGLLAALEQTEKRLASAQEKLGDPATPPIEREQAEKIIRLEQDSTSNNPLRELYDRATRLRDDSRMIEAYAILMTELITPLQWQGFIKASLGAHYDYQWHRDAVKAAKKLTKEIESQAQKLAESISEFNALGFDNAPSEINGIQYLLNTTEADDFKSPRLLGWRKFKSSLLGEIQSDQSVGVSLKPIISNAPWFEIVDIADTGLARAHNPPIRQVARFGPDQDEISRAWIFAPNMPALLRKLADIVRNYQPRQVGLVGAALVSQKPVQHTEYIRGLAYLLTHNFQIQISNQTMKAIAIVTNVTFNDPDLDVTYDDVRKALR